jgi:hypothetical protein
MEGVKRKLVLPSGRDFDLTLLGITDQSGKPGDTPRTTHPESGSRSESEVGCSYENYVKGFVPPSEQCGASSISALPIPHADPDHTTARDCGISARVMTSPMTPALPCLCLRAGCRLLEKR